MAPSVARAVLSKRQFGYGYGYDCDSFNDCGNSAWYDWGRWVALAAIIVAFIFLALALSCMNNRRRRMRGAPPMYGTSWFPTNNYKYGQNGQPGYYPDGPAPPYVPQVENQATGNTFNSRDGYYGNHGGSNGAYELQPPTSVYQPQRENEPYYYAAQGPPPKN